MEFLSELGGWASVGSLGSTGLLALTVLGFLTGRIRPQRAIDEVRADRDARLAEASIHVDKFKEINGILEKAYLTAESTRSALAEHLAKVVHEKELQSELVSKLISIVSQLQHPADGNPS